MTFSMGMEVTKKNWFVLFLPIHRKIKINSAVFKTVVVVFMWSSLCDSCIEKQMLVSMSSRQTSL